MSAKMSQLAMPSCTMASSHDATRPGASRRTDEGTVGLSWIPHGTGGAGRHLVWISGRVFTRLRAWRERRRPLDLCHAARSIAAWLLARVGFDVARIVLPEGGRAPGRDAGLVVASRDGGSARAAPATVR